MPFLAEKITGMLYQILKLVTPQDMLEGDEAAAAKEKDDLKERLKAEVTS
jgi:hypothetical protein